MSNWVESLEKAEKLHFAFDESENGVCFTGTQFLALMANAGLTAAKITELQVILKLEFIL